MMLQLLALVVFVCVLAVIVGYTQSVMNGTTRNDDENQS